MSHSDASKSAPRAPSRPKSPDAGTGRLTYEAVTDGVKVTVRPVFLEDQSDPEESHYLWAYHIRIENQGGDEVKLLSRRWRITDGFGQVREVDGPGVVGEQPTLAPGGSFEYTSGAPLTTPSGFMGGAYEMSRTDGSRLDVEVPTFSLDSPYAEARILH